MVKTCMVMGANCRMTNRKTGQLRTVPVHTEVFCTVYMNDLIKEEKSKKKIGCSHAFF